MRQLDHLSDEELDAPHVRSVGIASIQGHPVLVLVESRGDRILSKHYIHTDIQSTAAAEGAALAKDVLGLCRP